MKHSDTTGQETASPRSEKTIQIVEDVFAERVRLDDALCFALYNATNSIIRAYRPLLQKIGLTYPQYLVMMTLWDQGAMRTVDVARRLDLAPNAITPLIDRLEATDLVTRVPSETDRRTSMIHLTDRGAELEKAASVIQHAVGCNIALEPSRHAPLLHDLKRIVAGMEEGELLKKTGTIPDDVD